jgi:cytochrome c-type biogenesis protein CcmH/NrfG
MSEDNNAEILAELRKLKRVFYIILVFIFIGSLPAFYAGFTRGSTSGNSWARVRTAMDRQDFPAALSMAQTLTTRQPDYYYGHSFLGAIYLAMGDITNSEAQYSRAYQLFPSEDGAKDLAAVRKRLAAGGDFKLLSK